MGLMLRLHNMGSDGGLGNINVSNTHTHANQTYITHGTYVGWTLSYTS